MKTTNKLTLATTYKVVDKNGERCIQLFDEDGNKVDGDKARWIGSFNCAYSNLTSLEGAPSEVGRSFFCYNNNLTSLIGAPSRVGRSFFCYNNPLMSTAYKPQNIQGGFYAPSDESIIENIRKFRNSLHKLGRFYV